jgi:hypothetical protein
MFMDILIECLRTSRFLEDKFCNMDKGIPAISGMSLRKSLKTIPDLFIFWNAISK